MPKRAAKAGQAQAKKARATRSRTRASKQGPPVVPTNEEPVVTANPVMPQGQLVANENLPGAVTPQQPPAVGAPLQPMVVGPYQQPLQQSPSAFPNPNTAVHAALPNYGSFPSMQTQGAFNQGANPTPMSPPMGLSPQGQAGQTWNTGGLAPTSFNQIGMFGVPGAISGVMAGQPAGPGLMQGPTSVPLAASVPEAIKAKIWANQYFPIRQILTTESKPGLKVVPNGDSFSIQPLAGLSDQEIESLDKWLSAFARYSCVYLMLKPGEAAGLLHYQETVRDLAREGGDWRYYDENFRKYRQGGQVPWDTHCAELWNKAMSRARNTGRKNDGGHGGSFFSKKNEAGNNSFPRGFCWLYHRTGSCKATSCPFQHNCFKCGATHPIQQCRFGERSQGPAGARQGQGFGKQSTATANASQTR